MFLYPLHRILTPALISGALIGRLRFRAWVLFVLLWSTLVYDLVSHWVWSRSLYILFLIIHFVSHNSFLFRLCADMVSVSRRVGRAALRCLIIHFCFSLYILFLIIHCVSVVCVCQVGCGRWASSTLPAARWCTRRRGFPPWWRQPWFVSHYTFCFSLYILFFIIHLFSHYTFCFGCVVRSGRALATRGKRPSLALTIFLLSCWDQPWYLRTTVRLSQYSFCHILFLLLHYIPFVYVGISLGT